MGQRCVCGSWDPASWEPLTRTTGPFIYSASLIAESLIPQNASGCKRSFTSNIIINADININLQNSEPPCKMPLHDNYHVDKDPPFPSYRYFALGLLYHYKGQDSAALQVWTNNTPSFCCCCQKATNSEMLFLVINLVPLVSLFVILTTDVDSNCGWWPAGRDQIWSLFLHCGLPVLLLQSGHNMEVCWLGTSEGSHCRLWVCFMNSKHVTLLDQYFNFFFFRSASLSISYIWNKMLLT